MRLHYWEDVLHKLDAIDRAQLSPKERLNYDVYRPQIEGLVANQRFRDYEMPVNSDTTFWTNLGYTARRPFRRREDYTNWLGQLKDLPRYFNEQMDEMRAGAARGFTPPAVTMKGRDGSITAVTQATPENSLLYTPFKEMPGFAPEEAARLRAEAVKTIRDVVQPAYVKLLNFMRDEYLPASAHEPRGAGSAGRQGVLPREDPRVHDSRYRSGSDPCARRTRGRTAARRDACGNEADGIQGRLPGVPEVSAQRPAFYVKTPVDLLDARGVIAKEFDGKASQYFGYLPRARFAIKPVPEDLAPFYTAGRGGPGVYLVNTYDLPTRPLYNMVALTLHESAPGHAFQMPIALEHKDQPQFRQHTYISAYGEGWALYCEKLGVEMGMYKTPYDRFGMLGYQIWRAARLVIDTGIHAQGWTREQAIDYLKTYTALPEHEIETEVDRYIAWPGQALSYYLGEMAIVKARAKAEAELGARFNLRAFHDAVLELGSVPLPVLTARVDRFIAEGGKGPVPGPGRVRRPAPCRGGSWALRSAAEPPESSSAENSYEDR